MRSLILNLLLATTAGAVGPGQHAFDRFGGLQDDLPPAVIQRHRSPDLLNVEPGHGLVSIGAREGFSKFADLQVSTGPVLGSARFTNQSGDLLDVVCHDKYCASSANGSSFVNFLSTASSDIRRWVFTTVDGFLFGANDQRDAIFKYDGTDLFHSTNIPAGTVLALTPFRMVVANLSGAPSEVRYSRLSDPSNFTQGTEPDDGWTDILQAPGDRVTAIVYHKGLLYIFKNISLTTCLIADQFTTQCELLSDKVGAADAVSVISTPYGLYWKSENRSYWRLADDGNVRPISRHIEEFVKSQLEGAARSHTETTEADFQSGSSEPVDSWDPDTIPGSSSPPKVVVNISIP